MMLYSAKAEMGDHLFVHTNGDTESKISAYAVGRPAGNLIFLGCIILSVVGEANMFQVLGDTALMQFMIATDKTTYYVYGVTMKDFGITVPAVFSRPAKAGDPGVYDLQSTITGETL